MGIITGIHYLWCDKYVSSFYLRKIYMADIPLITVVIPTFNRPEHLRQAVASVQMQGGVDTQIIIVDDASDIDLREEYINQKNVTYVRNQKNYGGSYSRNAGLKLARGEYINFLDDDDEFLENKLSLQVQQFERSTVLNLALVSCHMRDFRSGKEMIIKNTARGDVYLDSLRRYTVKGTPTMLFRTEAIKLTGGFDEQLPASQEYDLIIRLSKNYGVDYVDAVLAQANRSTLQISLDFERKKTGTKMLFNKYNDEYRKAGFIFWLTMRLKFRVLCFRLWAGKHFGESVYKFLLFGKGI